MLEFASAFLPEATASIKDDLGPPGPLHFQRNPWKARLPRVPGRAELRWAVGAAGQGAASPTCPTAQPHPDRVTAGEPSTPEGLFRVYPAPLMENLPLLPAIPRFLMFFLSSLFSLPVQGSCSALLIRGWL